MTPLGKFHHLQREPGEVVDGGTSLPMEAGSASQGFELCLRLEVSSLHQGLAKEEDRE